MPRLRFSARELCAAIVVVFVVYLYTQGTFDNFLWRVGLNYQECATNGFGATFCGDQLERYNRIVNGGR